MAVLNEHLVSDLLTKCLIGSDYLSSKQSRSSGRAVQAIGAGFPAEVGSALAESASGLSVYRSLGWQKNIVGGPVESPWPKNVGLLFFSKALERFFPGTQIDVLWFPEGAGDDRFDEKNFKGPVGSFLGRGLQR